MTEQTDRDADIRLIVGLGNPGKEYARTRHNAGFWFADRLAARHGGRFRAERRFRGEGCRLEVAGRELRLFKPLTYMNRSGAAVREYCAYAGIAPAELLVAHDELDLPFGTVRLKRGGGPGGHNGLRDLIAQIGRDFLRLRFGVGHPGNRNEVIDYVLQRPPADEETAILAAIDEGLDVLPLLLEAGEQKAMSRLNVRREPAAQAVPEGD